MMRTLSLAILLLTTALAGCLGDETAGVQSDDGATDGAPAGGNETTGAGNETTAAPAAENAPPTADLTANVTNGSAPLAVGFDMGGDDEDGDNLTWSFDADGDGEADADGTELPATFAFTYEEAGNYTAVLTVSDAEDSASANVTITVEVPVEAGPNICDRPNADSYGDTIYVLDEGGTWFFAETNGMPGLQVENNHPSGEGIFINDDWADCVQGDQMVL